MNPPSARKDPKARWKVRSDAKRKKAKDPDAPKKPAGGAYGASAASAAGQSQETGGGCGKASVG